MILAHAPRLLAGTALAAATALAVAGTLAGPTSAPSAAPDLRLAATTSGCAWATPPGEPDQPGEPARKREWGPERPADQVQVVQANVRAGMSVETTERDLGKVFKDCPDFVTLNEVPGRPDDVLAPHGYALWRTPGQYTGETPVLWRTDKWSPIARGTTMISDKRGYGEGQSVMWGVRHANWATLRSTDGEQTISLVSIHIAPKSARTTELLGPSVRRLGDLVGMLASEGPVLVGGDFNRHYTSSEYPRARLDNAGLNAVYDLSGFFEPTGDHRGATIDYVMVRPARSFEVRRQVTRELRSDHDALVVDLGVPARTTGEKGTSFSAGTLVNDPLAATAQGRTAVTRTLLTALRKARSGGSVKALAAEVSLTRVSRALLKAARRDVQVRVITNAALPTTQEAALREGLRRAGNGSWLRRRPAADATASTVLVSRSARTDDLRLDVDRGLSADLHERFSTMRLHTTGKPYRAAEKSFTAQKRGR